MSPPAPLRVLLFAFDLDQESGWGHLSLETARSLAHLGHGVKVVAAGNAGVVDTPGIEVFHDLWAPRYDKARLSWLPRRPLRLLRLVRWSQIVHVTVEPLSVLAVAATLGRRPVVQTGVGTFSIAPFRRPGLARALFARAWRRLDGVVAISRFTAGRIRDHHPGVEVEVARPGVRFPGTEPPPRAAWRFPPAILAVAAVKQRKGLGDLVEGFARFHRRYPGATLHVAGRIESEAEHGRLLRGIAAHGLQGAVSILGHVDDATLDRLYRESQVLALTPTSSEFNFEGFGLVYLEANTYGLPVIGTTGCGAEDAIDPGVSGLLVPPADPEGIAEALAAVTRQEEHWRSLSRGALEHAARLSWPAYATRLEALYRRILAGEGPAVRGAPR